MSHLQPNAFPFIYVCRPPLPTFWQLIGLCTAKIHVSVCHVHNRFL